MLVGSGSWSISGYLQASKEHDGNNGDFHLFAHLQGPNARYGNNQNDDVVNHVHDSKNKEKELDVDACSLCADVLIPEETNGSTRTGHGDPEDEGVDGSGEASYPV